ncbi:hypothetical protein OROHE_002265 [Orobanche hederae]
MLLAPLGDLYGGGYQENQSVFGDTAQNVNNPIIDFDPTCANMVNPHFVTNQSRTFQGPHQQQIVFGPTHVLLLNIHSLSLIQARLFMALSNKSLFLYLLQKFNEMNALFHQAFPAEFALFPVPSALVRSFPVPLFQAPPLQVQSSASKPFERLLADQFTEAKKLYAKALMADNERRLTTAYGVRHEGVDSRPDLGSFATDVEHSGKESIATGLAHSPINSEASSASLWSRGYQENQSVFGDTAQNVNNHLIDFDHTCANMVNPHFVTNQSRTFQGPHQQQIVFGPTHVLLLNIHSLSLIQAILFMALINKSLFLYLLQPKNLERHYVLSGDADGEIMLWEFSLADRKNGGMWCKYQRRYWQIIFPTSAGGECKLSYLDSLVTGKKPMVALSLVELPENSGHLALAMGGLDNKIHIYSGERTGKVFPMPVNLKGHTGHTDWIRSLDFSLPLYANVETSILLVSSSQDKGIRLWKMALLADSSKEETSVAAYIKGPVFLAGELSHCALGNVGTDFDDWKPQKVPSGHFAPVSDIAWARDGKYLLSVSHDQTSRVFSAWTNESLLEDGEAWHEIARPQVHGHDINCVTLIRGKGNHRFVSGAEEKVFESPLSFLKTLNHTTSKKSGFHDLPSNIQILGANMSALGLSQKPIYLHGLDTLETIPGAVPTVLTEPPIEEQLSWHTLWSESHKLYGHGNELFSLCSDHEGKPVASSCKAQLASAPEIWLWQVGSWKAVGRLHSQSNSNTVGILSR